MYKLYFILLYVKHYSNVSWCTNNVSHFSIIWVTWIVLDYSWYYMLSYISQLTALHSASPLTIPLPEYPCVDPASIDKQQFHRYRYTVASTQWTQGTQCSILSIPSCPSSPTLSRIPATQSVQWREKNLEYRVRTK